MINFLENFEADITPRDFEKLCLDLLMKTKNFKSINVSTVQHNRKEKTSDGEFQLDGYIEYELLNVKHKVIIECKKHARPIQRSVVMELKSKLESIGAQKGILMSTSGFQTGAIEYAKQHGIGLMQVIEKNLLTIQNSITPRKNILQRYLNMPPYGLIMYNTENLGMLCNLNNNIEYLEHFLTYSD